MDESWRMRMGIAASTTKNSHRHRRSTEETTHWSSSENPLLQADDFNDVFGGPPRTVISRQFSGEEYFPRASAFYEDVFQAKENMGSGALPVRGRRSLPEFGGPAEKGAWRNERYEGFYGDIFGWKDEEGERRRWKSKSKTSSSSVMSSDDMSPSQVVTGGGEFREDDISQLASKLRSINVPKRWHSNIQIEGEVHVGYQGIPTSSSNNPFFSEYESIDNMIKRSNRAFRRKNPSPEDSNSPSSVVSSLWQDHEASTYGTSQNEALQEQDACGEVEAMKSYVTQLNANICREETDEAIGVEEAIAWAKAKFQSHCSNATPNQGHFSSDQDGGNETSYAQEEEESDYWSSAEMKQQKEQNMEMELLNEKIRLWSSGKEADIRLLLSTLHHILWPASGWVPVPLTSLIESRQVKKAYQRARLFLHPDKLQQRGATCLQKYIADKAFPILQVLEAPSEYQKMQEEIQENELSYARLARLVRDFSDLITVYDLDHGHERPR